MHQAARIADPLSFVFGGKAIFTLRSKRTGDHRTYRVVRAPEKRFGLVMYFVGLLTGPDNTRDYSHIGCLWKDADGNVRFKVGGAGFGAGVAVVAFQWMVDHVGSARFDEQAELWHEGRCCRCGALLTTPRSVANGIGPVCEERRG